MGKIIKGTGGKRRWGRIRTVVKKGVRE